MNETTQAIDELKKTVEKRNKIDIADRILWFIVGGLIVWFLSHLGIL